MNKSTKGVHEHSDFDSSESSKDDAERSSHCQTAGERINGNHHSRGISDEAPRIVDSVALVATAAVASPENSPKYPVGTKVKKVCITQRNN